MASSSSSSSSLRKKSGGGKALLNAASTGNLDLLKRLVNKLVNDGEASSLMEIKDANGRCALSLAAYNGKTQVCKYLIDQLKFDIDVKDEMGNTPLTLAIIKGHHLTCSYLLNQGAQPTVANTRGMTALHFAAEKGKVDLMRLLISNGAEVDKYCIGRGTPLHCAASSGVKGAIKLLLDNHANPNSNSSFCALMNAILGSSVDCMKLLLERGADPNKISLGATPLIMAAMLGEAELIKCLLKAGADPDVTDFYDSTAIEIAARGGNIAALNVLLQATTRIAKIPVWSCDGILEYVNSEEAINEHNLKIEEKFVEAKELGDEAVRSNEHFLATYWYQRALYARPRDAAVLSNRSLCWARLEKGDLALKDAFDCLRLRSDWPKGYYRAGVAFRVLGKYKEAGEAFRLGLSLDPKNKELQDACRDAMERAEEELVKDFTSLSTNGGSTSMNDIDDGEVDSDDSDDGKERLARFMSLGEQCLNDNLRL